MTTAPPLVTKIAAWVACDASNRPPRGSLLNSPHRRHQPDQPDKTVSSGDKRLAEENRWGPLSAFRAGFFVPGSSEA